MSERPELHILWTMDCSPISKSAKGGGLHSWEMGGRAMESFCSLLLNAGYAPTLFLSAACAEEYSPLLEELVGRGVEMGLHLHPPDIDDSRYKRPFGAYNADQQRALVELATDRVEYALGFRPRSFRSGQFSANDATYKILYGAGFRQGSLSNPGRRIPREAAQWEAAEEAPHYVDPDNRLRTGRLPFLELPVTTDPTQHYRGGLAYELCIESGPLEEWHRPIIERQLQRMEEQAVAFRSLCLFTHNYYAYHVDDDWRTKTLNDILDYFETLAETYTLVPVTLAGAHERFRYVTV